MSAAECEYCGRRLVLLRCEYPFWFHEGDTPRHGDWVPEHDCVADACRAAETDAAAGCDPQ